MKGQKNPEPSWFSLTPFVSASNVLNNYIAPRQITLTWKCQRVKEKEKNKEKKVNRDFTCIDKYATLCHLDLYSLLKLVSFLFHCLWFGVRVFIVEGLFSFNVSGFRGILLVFLLLIYLMVLVLEFSLAIALNIKISKIFSTYAWYLFIYVLVIYFEVISLVYMYNKEKLKLPNN